MTKKKPAAGVVTRHAPPESRHSATDEPDDDASPFEDPDYEDNEKLDEFRENFGGKQYYVRVERLNEDSNEMEIVDKIFLDTFDPFILAKKYGGGKFVCSLLNESGKYVKGGRMRFTFAKPLQPAAGPAAPNPMENPVVNLMIEQMKANQAMLAELLSKSLGATKETDIDKLLSGLKTLQDLTPREKEHNPMKQFMEFFTFQKQMKDAMGDEDKGPGLMTEITEALKLLTATRGLPRPRVPGAPLPTKSISGLPTVTATAAAPAPEAATVPTYSPAVMKLLFYLPKFEEAAAAQADPEKWASFLCDILDNEIVPALVVQYSGFVEADGVWERLIRAAGDPEKVNVIFQVAPSLDPHRPWVMSVIQAAAKQMTEEDPVPAPAPVNANGSPQ